MSFSAIPHADAQFLTVECLWGQRGCHVGSDRSPLAPFLSWGSTAACRNISSDIGDCKISKQDPWESVSGIKVFLYKTEISASCGGGWCCCNSTWYCKRHMKVQRLNAAARISLLACENFPSVHRHGIAAATCFLAMIWTLSTSWHLIWRPQTR